MSALSKKVSIKELPVFPTRENRLLALRFVGVFLCTARIEKLAFQLERFVSLAKYWDSLTAQFQTLAQMRSFTGTLLVCRQKRQWY